ncbi:hypothetical protein CBR_g50565 [Chara braunii]|uniref:HAT C-terminal dimerisation domain-containing protein n=1 Tax=Chara braunii TaxID=69332 RepID=A0A388M705_CHABU|nr:hypothetical protein CBR_g50565 [Chara braunii]|eukprot:GBG90316.1 hypothetical protein CBR_g50565 [Chara braunii]
MDDAERDDIQDALDEEGREGGAREGAVADEADEAVREPNLLGEEVVMTSRGVGGAGPTTRAQRGEVDRARREKRTVGQAGVEVPDTGREKRARQTTIVEMYAREKLAEFHDAWLQWIYVKKLPFNAFRGPEFQRVWQAAERVPHSIQFWFPSLRVTAGAGIPSQRAKVATMVSEVRATFWHSGATILSDGRKSRSGKPLVNFLAGPSSPPSHVMDRRRSGRVLYRTVRDQMRAFHSRRGDWGDRELSDAEAADCRGDSETERCVAWWFEHGRAHPELRTIAIRVMHLWTSASPAERNWAEHERVSTARRCKLGFAKLAQLVEIATNLKLASCARQGGGYVLPWVMGSGRGGTVAEEEDEEGDVEPEVWGARPDGSVPEQEIQRQIVAFRDSRPSRAHDDIDDDWTDDDDTPLSRDPTAKRVYFTYGGGRDGTDSFTSVITGAVPSTAPTSGSSRAGGGHGGRSHAEVRVDDSGEQQPRGGLRQTGRRWEVRSDSEVEGEAEDEEVPLRDRRFSPSHHPISAQPEGEPLRRLERLASAAGRDRTHDDEDRGGERTPSDTGIRPRSPSVLRTQDFEDVGLGGSLGGFSVEGRRRASPQDVRTDVDVERGRVETEEERDARLDREEEVRLRSLPQWEGRFAYLDEQRQQRDLETGGEGSCCVDDSGVPEEAVQGEFDYEGQDAAAAVPEGHDVVMGGGFPSGGRGDSETAGDEEQGAAVCGRGEGVPGVDGDTAGVGGDDGPNGDDDDDHGPEDDPYRLALVLRDPTVPPMRPDGTAHTVFDADALAHALTDDPFAHLSRKSGKLRASGRVYSPPPFTVQIPHWSGSSLSGVRGRESSAGKVGSDRRSDGGRDSAGSMPPPPARTPEGRVDTGDRMVAPGVARNGGSPLPVRGGVGGGWSAVRRVGDRLRADYNAGRGVFTGCAPVQTQPAEGGSGRPSLQMAGRMLGLSRAKTRRTMVLEAPGTSTDRLRGEQFTSGEEGLLMRPGTRRQHGLSEVEARLAAGVAAGQAALDAIQRERERGIAAQAEEDEDADTESEPIETAARRHRAQVAAAAAAAKATYVSGARGTGAGGRGGRRGGSHGRHSSGRGHARSGGR